MIKNLLSEIEHELVILDGCFVTDKDLAFFNDEDKESFNYWRIDNSALLKKIETELYGKPEGIEDVSNKIKDILKQMNDMNDVIKVNPTVSDVDKIYFENKFAILNMEYNYYMQLLK